MSPGQTLGHFSHAGARGGIRTLGPLVKSLAYPSFSVPDPEWTSKPRKDDYICNFRAPSLREYEDWQAYKEYVWTEGLDVCRVTIGLTNAFMSGVKGALDAKGKEQVVNIQMNNQFLYQVSKPRREPYVHELCKSEFRRTVSSAVYDAYVLEKAREIGREFSYRDFLELKHDAFRRIVLRLRRKGKIIANPKRSNPRFYFLAEQREEYDPRWRTIQ